MNLQSLYERSPVAAQNLMATGYGVREWRRRHTGGYTRLVDEVTAREWWDPEQLNLLSMARLRSMLRFCDTHVPHYRDQFRQLGFEPDAVRDVADLAGLPLLDKEEVREAPERFRPDGGPEVPAVAQTTGGTTGTPLRYWASLDAVRGNYATYEARSRRWSGARFGDRLASLHGQPIVPFAQAGPPYWRRNRAFNQLYCSVYHLSDDTAPAYLGALERFQPEVLAGYTSAVHRLATAVLARGDQGRIHPRAIIVSSETLLPAARADIEMAFGCRVHDAYSLGELVAYVSQCPHGEMHVSSDYGVLELLDDGDGRSEIVATGLLNRAMPLIRYRTGDSAEPADDGPGRCGRGLPRLASLQGRLDDVVRTPEGAAVGAAPMSLAFQKVPHLRRAQVVQESVDALLVRLEPAPEFTEDDRALLHTELRRRLGPTITLDYEIVDTLPRTSGGKERLVVSRL